VQTIGFAVFTMWYASFSCMLYCWLNMLATMKGLRSFPSMQWIRILAVGVCWSMLLMVSMAG
jgi:hypothetical protein